MDRESFNQLMEAGAFTPEWEPPIPFDTIKTPDFPIHNLPLPMAAFVDALIENTQTPAEMAGVLSLGVLATAFQSRREVQIRSDWKEPLCLYTVAVAPPGERKSPVISALTNPLYEYEAEQKELEAVEIYQNQTERELLEKALQMAKSDAVKGKGNSAAKKQEALNLSAQLARFKDLHPYRLLVDDCTQEKLIDIMEQQGGSITLTSSEGGVFDTIAGRYDRTANLDVYLKAQCGDSISVDRIGRDSNRIPKPRLTMILTIQPSVLYGLMENTTLKGRGLCGRFLYTICGSKVGHREVSPPSIPDKVRSDYRQFIRRILSDQGSGIVSPSPDANSVREDYQRYIETKLGNEWEHMRDWGGKLTGTMMRIAALLHLSSSPDTDSMSAETVVKAVGIAECLSSHAEAAYQMMGGDKGQVDAKYLWRRIQNTGQDEMSKRDLFNTCKGKFKTVENIEPALNVLVDMGYIQVKTVQTGGRPTQKIKVNPLAQK